MLSALDLEQLGAAWMAFEEEANADLELRRATGYVASVDAAERLAALGEHTPDIPYGMPPDGGPIWD